MRREKSNFIYYAAAVLLIIALGFVMLHEIPLKQEHIEEVLK